MTQKDRKNFPIKVIREVYDEQGQCCSKCGTPIVHGFQAHHIDGDHSNAVKENCALMCISCHGGEMYATLIKQKESAMKQLDDLVDIGLLGKCSGATLDKMLDAIKMKLSLSKQISGEEYFSAPPEQKLKYSYIIAEANLKAFEEGYKQGVIGRSPEFNSKEKS